MKITINSKSFVDAVSWVTKSYDMKNDRAYVTLSIDAEGEGILSHANTNSYMKSNFSVVSVDFDGDDKDSASFAVDGAYLKNLSNAIGSSSGEVVISKKLKSEKTSLNVKTDLGRFTIPLLDYAVSEEPTFVEIGEVDDNDFFDSLTRIAKLCDSDNSGSSSFIGSVDFGFNVEDKTVNMFATDRYALGEISLDFSPSDNQDDDTVEDIVSKHVLLPSSSATIIPATKGVNTSITLIAEDSGDGTLRFGYSFPDSRIALFSLVNAATFPHTQAMKDKALKEVEHEITVETSDLKNAIRTISSLSPSEDDIYFTIDGDGLTVTDSAMSNSLQVDSKDVDYENEDEYRARFVRSVINEAFSPVSTSKMKLKWGSNSMAFVFEPLTEDGQSVENVFVMAVLGKLN